MNSGMASAVEEFVAPPRSIAGGRRCDRSRRMLDVRMGLIWPGVLFGDEIQGVGLLIGG
jgi:hypothetical protein